MLNINARSIVNKTNELESVLLSHSPHVVVITETWLHGEISDTDLIPPAYKIIRRDRTSRGGGVAIVVKSSVQVILLSQSEDTESLSVKLNIYGHVFVLCAIYRPPDASSDYLLKVRDHISQFNKNKLLVVGDFNLPGVDWDRVTSGACSVLDANVLFDMMFDHNLVQVVREPTRHGTGVDSLLDLVFLERSFSDYRVSVEPGLSDHDIVAVYFSLNVSMRMMHMYL